MHHFVAYWVHSGQTRALGINKYAAFDPSATLAVHRSTYAAPVKAENPAFRVRQYDRAFLIRIIMLSDLGDLLTTW